jgi:hypothetical protein
MRVLMVSKTGYGLGLASHLSSEGHAVNMVISRDDFESIGHGIISRTGQSRPDITVFDSADFGRESDILRQDGMRVFGSSSWAQALQADENYKQSIIKSMGWPTDLIKGVDCYISCWFNGVDYISTYLSLVYHRMNPGGASPDVGFTGCVSNFWQPSERVKVSFLDPLCKVLRRANHRGCFHIRCTISLRPLSIPFLLCCSRTLSTPSLISCYGCSLKTVSASNPSINGHPQSCSQSPPSHTQSTPSPLN